MMQQSNKINDEKIQFFRLIKEIFLTRTTPSMFLKDLLQRCQNSKQNLMDEYESL